jgi:hypothetical protein
MEQKLNFSLGILSWKSPRTLINTLSSYLESELLEIANDVTIFFQEGSNLDKEIAQAYKVKYILSPTNVGIGKAFTALAESAETDYILLNENDWINIENKETTYTRINDALRALSTDEIDVVKMRHRKNPGDPLYTRQYAGKEMVSSKHLFECVHWRENPDKDFPAYIGYSDDVKLYFSDSKYANQTNNPCIYKKEFYLKNISPFSGEGIDLEGKIDGWWQKQMFTVAHGEGLFTHHRIDR